MTDDGTLATFRRRLESEPGEYLRECGLELAKLLGFVVVTAIVGAWLDPSVPGRALGPGAVFTSAPVLGALALALLWIAFKPARHDVGAFNRHYRPGLIARTVVLYAVLVVFLSFAVGVAGRPLGLRSLPLVLGELLGGGGESGSALSGGAPVVIGLGTLTLLALVASGVALVSAITGAIAGGVVGLVGWGVGVDQFLAGAAVGTVVGAVVGATLVLDPRQVDRRAVAGAALVGTGLLVFAPEPDLVLGWSAAVAGAVAGSAESHEEPTRPTNALLAFRAGTGVAEIPGYDDAPGWVRESPDGTDAARGALRYAVEGGWGRLVTVALVFLLSPLLLFLPLVSLVGYFCRILGAAAHECDTPPDMPLVTGRRALFKEGAFGLVALSPLVLLAGALSPPVIEAVPPVELGTGTLDTSPIAGIVVDVYAAVGLPAPLVGHPLPAVLGLAVVAGLVPPVATGYATTGRVRAAFDPRRLRDLVDGRRYFEFLLVQFGYLLVVPLVATIGAAAGLLIAASLAAGVGPVGGLVALLVVIGYLTVLAVVPTASAALWGIYARGQPTGGYEPLLERVAVEIREAAG